MLIEKKSPHIFQVTLSGYELATLISSARWALEGANGELTPEAAGQLKQVITNYDYAAGKAQVNPR